MCNSSGCSSEGFLWRRCSSQWSHCLPEPWGGPSISHLHQARHLLCCLAGVPPHAWSTGAASYRCETDSLVPWKYSYGLILRRSSPIELIIYTDADWAGYANTHRSTFIYIVFLGATSSYDRGSSRMWSPARASRQDIEWWQMVWLRCHGFACYCMSSTVLSPGVPLSTATRLGRSTSPLTPSSRLAPTYEACRDWSPLRSQVCRHRRCSSPLGSNDFAVHRHLHQGPILLGILEVLIWPRILYWLEFRQRGLLDC